MAHSGFGAAPADFAAAAPRLAEAADGLAAAASAAAAALADSGPFWGEDAEFGSFYLGEQRGAADLGARCEQGLRALAEQLHEAGAAYARAEAVALEGLHCAALRREGRAAGLVR